MRHAKITIASLVLLSHLFFLSLAQDLQDYKAYLNDEDDEDDEGGHFFVKGDKILEIPTSEPPNSPFICPYPLPPKNIPGTRGEHNIWPIGFALVHYPKLYDLCSGLSPSPNAGCICLAPGYSSAMDCWTPPGNEDIFDSLLLEYCWSRCQCRVRGKPYDLPPDDRRKAHTRPFTWTEIPVSNFSDGEDRRAWVNQGFGGWRVLEERGRLGRLKTRIETVVIPPDRDIEIPPPRLPPLLSSSSSSSPATIAGAIGKDHPSCKARLACNSFEALNGGCGSSTGCRCFFDELSSPWFGKGSCGGALSVAALGFEGVAASAGLGGRDLSSPQYGQEDDSLLNDDDDDEGVQRGVCACNATFVARACCAAFDHGSGGGGGGGGIVVYEGEAGAEKLGELLFEDL